jgi:hypothetical protein
MQSRACLQNASTLAKPEGRLTLAHSDREPPEQESCGLLVPDLEPQAATECLPSPSNING